MYRSWIYFTVQETMLMSQTWTGSNNHNFYVTSAYLVVQYARRMLVPKLGWHPVYSEQMPNTSPISTRLADQYGKHLSDKAERLDRLRNVRRGTAASPIPTYRLNRPTDAHVALMYQHDGQPKPNKDHQQYTGRPALHAMRYESPTVKPSDLRTAQRATVQSSGPISENHFLMSEILNSLIIKYFL